MTQRTNGRPSSSSSRSASSAARPAATTRVRYVACPLEDVERNRCALCHKAARWTVRELSAAAVDAAREADPLATAPAVRVSVVGFACNANHAAALVVERAAGATHATAVPLEGGRYELRPAVPLSFALV